MDFLARPILLLVDLVDGLGSRVVDIGGFCSLGDVHTLLVDELDEELPLGIWHRHVFLCHGQQFLFFFI